MYQAKEEKSIKSSRGITLIALIITIIVLLILAGVSISMVVGENGVLNRAQDASQKTKFASEKEAIEFIINDIKTGQMIGEEIPKDKIKGEELFTKNFENAAKWKMITENVNGKVVKKFEKRNRFIWNKTF